MQSIKQPKWRISKLLGCAVLLFAVAASLFASYSRARSGAMSLAATRQLIPLGSHLSFYRIDTQRFSPTWEFRFDPPDMFITAPLVIQVGFSGQVVATRPPNLLQLLTTK
jgi:hypothetical protein